MNRSPLKAIRRHCVGCSGGVFKEVEYCVIPEGLKYPTINFKVLNTMVVQKIKQTKPELF